MRKIAFLVFTLSLAAAPLTHARADEHKTNSTPAAASGAAAPSGNAKTTDVDKKSKVSEEDRQKQLDAHTNNFRQTYKDNPYTDKRAAMAEELAKSLSEDQVQAFVQIRDGAVILRTVRVTADEVGAAVASCGEHNPVLKQSLDDRFARWKKELDATLQKNDKAMDADIKSGMAGDSKKVQNYLKISDQWSAYNESKIGKTPAATESACKALQESMDKSGPALIAQLDTLKWPSPAPKKADDAKQEQTEPAAGKSP